jgi:hypothetical protein
MKTIKDLLGLISALPFAGLLGFKAEAAETKTTSDGFGTYRFDGEIKFPIHMVPKGVGAFHNYAWHLINHKEHAREFQMLLDAYKRQLSDNTIIFEVKNTRNIFLYGPVHNDPSTYDHCYVYDTRIVTNTAGLMALLPFLTQHSRGIWKEITL